MKAKELKNKSIKFELDGKEYPLVLDMNVLAELEDIYGDMYTALSDLEKMKIKAFRALIYAIVKVENDNVTLKEVGKMLDIDKIMELQGKIGQVLSNGLPEMEDNEGE